MLFVNRYLSTIYFIFVQCSVSFTVVVSLEGGVGGGGVDEPSVPGPHVADVAVHLRGRLAAQPEDGARLPEHHHRVREPGGGVNIISRKFTIFSYGRWLPESCEVSLPALRTW